MSVIKLALYGGIGYLIYQAFFNDTERPAEAPDAQAAQSGGGGGRGSRRGPRRSSGASNLGGGGQQLTGPGKGMNVSTQDPDGGVTRHRVGRGVV